MNTLTEKEKDTCIYTGLFGALLSTVCLIQLIIFTRAHWITFVVVTIYIYSIIAFTLLGLQKAVASWLLIANTILLFCAVTLFIIAGVFSLVISLSFIYSTTIVVFLFVDGLHNKLQESARAKKAEELAWRDKI
jgi:hypothetical protein